MEKRPRDLTPEMATAAATLLVDGMVKSGLLDESDREQSIEELAEEGDTWMDGYELAKALDHRGWAIDAQMVEELDGYRHKANDQILEAQKAWAARNNPQPSLAIGTRIKLRDGKFGAIDGIYEHGPAQFTVKVEGDPQAETHKARRIVNFEDAEAA